jgi:hypothetical protein
VVVSWEGAFRDVHVLLDGTDVGPVDGAKIKRGGAEVTLPDGTKLAVRVRGLLGIEILRDGEPLPGSDLDPKRVLRNAAILVWVLAVIDGAWDAARAARGMPLLAQGGHAALLALDAIFFLLGFATFFGLRVALGIGIAAFVLRFGFEPHKETLSLLYGLIATWVLATHFFAAGQKPRGFAR